MYLKQKMEEVLGVKSDYVSDKDFISENEAKFKEMIFQTASAVKGQEAIDYLKQGAKLVLYKGPVTFYYMDTHPIEKKQYLFANYLGEPSPLFPMDEIQDIKNNFEANAFFVLEEPRDEDGQVAFLLSDEQKELDAFFSFLDLSCTKRSIDLCLEQGNFEMAKELSSELGS